jgi:hypothetical protein
MKKLFVFWHQYLINDWQRIVDFQFSKLVTSGLYNSCEKITCGVVCSPENIEHHKTLIKNLAYINIVDPKKIEIHYSHENTFEYLTLKMLQDFSKDNDAYVLYFHTKGVSCPVSYTKIKIKKEKKRTHMENINIIRWRECVEKLDEGNMCCGTNKRRKFFVGNFWWANTDWIKKLPELQKITSLRKRAYYEKWLLWSWKDLAKQPKLYAFPWE